MSPQGQKANAETHVNPECLVTVDIRRFYPSVNDQFVFEIFQRFFRGPTRIGARPLRHCFLAVPAPAILPSPAVTTTISWEPPSVITNEIEVTLPFGFCNVIVPVPSGFTV